MDQADPGCQPVVMFEDPIYKDIPEMTDGNIRRILVQHYIKWGVTLLAGLAGIAFLFILRDLSLGSSKLWMGFLGFSLLALHFALGKALPMGRFHGSPLLERALKEREIEKARKKLGLK